MVKSLNLNNNIFVLLGVAVIFIAAVNLVSGNPAYRKEFDKIINGNDCLKTCMENVTKFDEEISLMKNPDLLRYFGKINEICNLISSTRQCIDECKIESNPFALDSINVICETENREKVDKIYQCLTETENSENNIYQTCANSCGDYNEINDQVHHLTQTIQESELKNDEKVNPIMEKTNQACSIFKCVTRCNIEEMKNRCGKDAAQDLQNLLQKVFDTQRKDIEKLNIVEAMAKNFPPQCNYLYDPSIIFEAANPNPSLDISNPAAAEILPKIQLELILKQLKLAERQDELITKENEKLNMEIELLSQKVDNHHKKQQQQHDHPQRNYDEENSQFLFN